MQQQIWKKFWPLEDTVVGLQKKCFSPNFNGLAIFVLFSSSTNQSARANTYWWLWLPIFNVCWRKQSTFPGRIPAQGLIISEHWVNKLRWQWALRRWNWTRCEKIRHKEAGLGGTKVESTQGRPWPCPQKIIKAPCPKISRQKELLARDSLHEAPLQWLQAHLHGEDSNLEVSLQVWRGWHSHYTPSISGIFLWLTVPQNFMSHIGKLLANFLFF